MSEQKTHDEIIAEMRGGPIPPHRHDRVLLHHFADRLDAAHKREAEHIHRAMVILAGIEMPDPDYPPKLWTALEDAYDALSDALGTDGETTADEEEAKANGRHFVIQPHGDAAKLREALKLAVEISEWCCAESDDPLDCCEFNCTYQKEPHGEAGKRCPWKKIRAALATTSSQNTQED